MFHALLICSDPKCTETFEAWAGTLEELEALACDCGCALALWSISEVESDGGEEPALHALSANSR